MEIKSRYYLELRVVVKRLLSHVIKEVNKPTIIITHNKTLAGQLYSEFKEMFPENAVEYFISYYKNGLKTVLFSTI